jgi:hypothetical protein
MAEMEQNNNPNAQTMRAIEAEMNANAVQGIDQQIRTLSETQTSIIAESERQALRDAAKVEELRSQGIEPPTPEETKKLQALVTSTVDSIDRVTQDSLRSNPGFTSGPWAGYVQELEVVKAQTMDIRDRMLLMDEVAAKDVQGIRQLATEVEDTLETAQANYQAAQESDDEYFDNPLSNW